MKNYDNFEKPLEALIEILRRFDLLVRLMSNQKAPAPADFPYYNNFDICWIFSIKDRTRIRWVKKGWLKPIKVEGKTFYLKSDVHEMLEKMRGKNQKPDE